MAEIHIRQRVRRPFVAFKNREEAGHELAGFVKAAPDAQPVVLALPRGGVPVALPLSEGLQAPLDLVLVRKLPLPTRPEGGFGAVAIDGSRILNDRMVKEFALSQREIEEISDIVGEEVRRRGREYLGEERWPTVEGKTVLMVDDGLATGYSMMAAAKMVRGLSAEKTVLCVPVSPADSLGRVQPYFDEIHCLIVQEFPPFAVASFYADFHDMSDKEVLHVLERHRQTMRSRLNVA
jgi:putative phosphoribosyl transferase